MSIETVPYEPDEHDVAWLDADDDADDDAVDADDDAHLELDSDVNPVSSRTSRVSHMRRPQRVKLPTAIWNNVVAPDDDEPVYTTAPVRDGLPHGASTIHVYLSFLERVSPDLAEIEDLALLQGYNDKGIAQEYGVAPSTIMRQRARARKRYEDWYNEQDLAILRSLTPDERRIEMLSRRNFSHGRIAKIVGMEESDVAATLTHIHDAYIRVRQRGLRWNTTGAPTRSTPLPVRGGVSNRQTLSPKTGDKRLKRGDLTRTRILEAIRNLTLVKGAPPTIRELQTELGMTSRNKLDYQLGRLQETGLVRKHPSGRGLEVIDQDVVSWPKYFAQK